MILVTGATGTVGRALVAELLERGEAVRAMARDPRRAELPVRAEVVPGDLTDLDSVYGAVSGVDAVFLLWPFTDVERARTLAPRVVKALASRGAHVVYLSAMGAPPESFWALVEDAVAAQAPTWAAVRPGGFAKNALGWADSIVRTGTVRWPHGAAQRSLIHEADIAAVAAELLLDRSRSGETPVITGPEALSQRDQVAAIGAAIGRELRWEEMPRDEAVAVMAEVFGDGDWAAAAVDGWGEMVHSPEPVTDQVERLTGRPPRSFRTWARDHAADFA